LILGDCRSSLATLPDQYVQTCITSPPYFGLRDYGLPPAKWPACEFVPMPGMPAVAVPAMECCLGLEADLNAYVAHVVLVFREVRRVLRDDGTLWLNLGDSYAGSGRGGYAGGKSTLQGTTEGQDNSRVARGSQLAAGFHAKQVVNGAIGRAWVPPPPPPGLTNKQLMGVPWRVAFALQADGWCLRQDIIWSKPNPMPESTADRCTKAHEYLFLLGKSSRYYFDSDAMSEPVVSSAADIKRAKVTGRGKQDASAAYLGAPQRDKSGGFPVKDKEKPTRNKRSVWTVATRPYAGAHFATFPPALIEPCVRAGAPFGGRVLDVFNGSGTTGEVAILNGRDYTGLELNPEYMALTRDRLALAQEEILW
jgi:DNA modification methylase